MTRRCTFSGKPMPEHWSIMGEVIKNEFCEIHPEVNLIAACPHCGAPVCCPQCCWETYQESQTSKEEL